MTPPSLPLSPEARQAIDYAYWLDTRAGFMVTYAINLAAIWHMARIKKTLRARAYEATEQHYQEICRKGRRYPDLENFRKAWSLHCKTPSAKV